MLFRSPPHIDMDCWFSDGNVRGTRRASVGEWTHVVHTYEKGRSRLFINGELDAESKGIPSLNVTLPAKFRSAAGGGLSISSAISMKSDSPGSLERRNGSSW